MHCEAADSKGPCISRIFPAMFGRKPRIPQCTCPFGQILPRICIPSKRNGTILIMRRTVSIWVLRFPLMTNGAASSVSYSRVSHLSGPYCHITKMHLLLSPRVCAFRVVEYCLLHYRTGAEAKVIRSARDRMTMVPQIATTFLQWLEHEF